MSDGHFIGLGDKTTCGGKVLDGDPSINIYGLLHACEGDRVTCGKHPGIYKILGGISHMNSHGRLMAGTLDSFSSCPCRARFIPSIYTAIYRNESYERPAMRRAAEPAPVAQAHRSAAQNQPTYRPSSHWTPSALNSPQGVEPGFYIVPQSTTRDALEATLFPTPDPAVMAKFRTLNPRTDNVKAGSLIVLSDPNNFQCSKEENQLLEAAALTHDAINPLSAADADFMMRHREQIQSFLAHSSTAIGAGETMLARNLDNLKTILQDIEALHQKAFLKDGHLRSPEFFAERKNLLARLDTHLTALTRRSAGIPDHPNLKTALGISSRSLVHRWSQAGAPGQIPGYATHIQQLAKASTVIKHGGWVGTAIGGGASYMKVKNVCSAGNQEACEKIKFTETGSFVGSVGGGAIVGAILSGSSVTAICIALGVPTAGVASLACAVVVVGAASVTAGVVGGAAGEQVGEKIYEAVK